jgi:hypothetical protein
MKYVYSSKHTSRGLSWGKFFYPTRLNLKITSIKASALWRICYEFLYLFGLVLNWLCFEGKCIVASWRGTLMGKNLLPCRGRVIGLIH